MLTKFWKHRAVSPHFRVPLVWYKTCLIHFWIVVALNFLSDSSCSFLIDPVFPLSQYYFLSLHALCSAVPSQKDQLFLISSFDVFKETFQCDVTQDSKEMEQLINLYQKRNKIQRHWCTATFLSSSLISWTLRLFLVFKAHTAECYSRCPDSLQIMWISDHIAPEKNGSLYFWSE